MHVHACKRLPGRKFTCVPCFFGGSAAPSSRPHMRACGPTSQQVAPGEGGGGEIQPLALGRVVGVKRSFLRVRKRFRPRPGQAASDVVLLDRCSKANSAHVAFDQTSRTCPLASPGCSPFWAARSQTNKAHPTTAAVGGGGGRQGEAHSRSRRRRQRFAAGCVWTDFVRRPASWRPPPPPSSS